MLLYFVVILCSFLFFTSSMPVTKTEVESPENLNKIYSKLREEEILGKIMGWTSEQLKSLYGLNGANDDYLGVNMWTSLNLSGRREGPLYAEEPRYIVMRKEDEFKPEINSELNDVPFIPPRGRKHLTALPDLLNRYEVFIPNRGKKDNVADIFKYDDLFFPNRGKKTFTNKYPKNVMFNCEDSIEKCCNNEHEQNICKLFRLLSR